MRWGGNDYEEDVNPSGPSSFDDYSDRWAYSSTGINLYIEGAPYLVKSISSLEPQIYQTARVAPNSLRYYGLCLREGSYKVRLHFAEIMFTNDHTFGNLGRRIFDVSIQVSETRPLKTFVTISPNFYVLI